MNGYTFSRSIFNWSFDNPDKTNPTLIAIYLFLVEINNRLGWKENFTITAKEVQEACGISSYNTYKKNLDYLIEYGFVKMVKKSRNQYTANVIALSKFDVPRDKALDTAMQKHLTEQYQSTCDILKPINHKPTNHKQREIPSLEEFIKYAFEKGAEKNLRIDKAKVSLKYDAWKENDWRTGKDRPIKNWKSTLLQTLAYLQKEVNHTNGHNGHNPLGQKTILDLEQEINSKHGITD